MLYQITPLAKCTFISTVYVILKELRHNILSCFFGSLKIVVNWKETFK